MRKLLSVSLAALFAVALGACDEQPTELETQAAASHGASGAFEASGTYRTVGSDAAQKNGFTRAGQKIGTLNIDDNGTSLTISGSASGLAADGDQRYVSLTYDKASSAQGPHACEPGRNVGIGTDHPLSLTITQMVIGPGTAPHKVTILGLEHATWDVDGNGDATLGPTGVLEYVSADMIGTVSIRDLTVNDGFGPEAVVACAKITHDPAN